MLFYCHAFSLIITNTFSIGVKDDKHIRDFTSQIAFFCGYAIDCNIFESLKASQRAKQNVEKYYAVIGIQEDMKKSMLVFERYIPNFFRNATNVYKELMVDTFNKGINTNTIKPKVQNIVNSVMQNFTMELDFYLFCKARLYRQYHALIKNNGI